LANRARLIELARFALPFSRRNRGRTVIDACEVCKRFASLTSVSRLVNRFNSTVLDDKELNADSFPTEE
jgi:hypothetical protein